MLLRLEGAAVFGVALFLYERHEAGWGLFLLLILAPDLSIAGYLAGPRAGSVIYDLVHTYVGPIVLAAIGVRGQIDLAISLALIWFAHIGIDRLIGFGLKYPTSFKDTHLQKV
jgi:hypothetical protein